MLDKLLVPLDKDGDISNCLLIPDLKRNKCLLDEKYLKERFCMNQIIFNSA